MKHKWNTIDRLARRIGEKQRSGDDYRKLVAILCKEFQLVPQEELARAKEESTVYRQMYDKVLEATTVWLHNSDERERRLHQQLLLR